MASTKAPDTQRITDDMHPGWTGPNATFREYPSHIAPVSKLALGIKAAMTNVGSVRIFGSHGIAKTAAVTALAPAIAESLGHQNIAVVKIPAATIGPDDMISAAPVRDGEGSMVLVELIMKSLIPGQEFLLIVDDSLMSPPLVQNQFMQLAAETKLGGFDLREHGCLGVIFLDNPTLDEANTLMDDLAQADRYITMEVTDQDTSPDVQLYLANKYPHIDLTEAFAARAALPPALRHIMSWRTFDQAIEIMLKGHPGFMSLPYVDGSYKFLTIVDSNDKVVDRTKEFFTKMAHALGVPYIERAHDQVSKAIRDGIANGWSVRIIGPHGTGKTEITKALVKEAGAQLVSWSAPVTDPDTLICPVPDRKGSLNMLLAERLVSPEPKVVFIDEASRPKDLLAYARTNELTHEHSLGGVKIPNLLGVIAAENPPMFNGRRYDVSKGTIAYADRYEITVVMSADDVRFYEWLQKELPAKMAARHPNLFAHRAEEIAAVAEAVCEWHRNDLDNDGRSWITPRNLERIINAYMTDVPLEDTLIWLGVGDRAPVPLALLHSRLSGMVRTGLRDIAANIDMWEQKLAEASAAGDHGLAATDTVHGAFINSDTELLWEHAEEVARLLSLMPPRFKVTYFHTSDEDRKKLWIAALGVASGRNPMSSLTDARKARTK